MYSSRAQSLTSSHTFTNMHKASRMAGLYATFMFPGLHVEVLPDRTKSFAICPYVPINTNDTTSASSSMGLMKRRLSLTI